MYYMTKFLRNIYNQKDKRNSLVKLLLNYLKKGGVFGSFFCHLSCNILS